MPTFNIITVHRLGKIPYRIPYKNVLGVRSESLQDAKPTVLEQ